MSDDPIYSYMDGVVARTTIPETNPYEGYSIRIYSKNPIANGYQYIRISYLHLVDKPSIEVGIKVLSGMSIGKMGTSGHSTGVHLHFEGSGSNELFNPDPCSASTTDDFRNGATLDPTSYLQLVNPSFTGQKTE